MKKVSRGEILDLEAYEAIRPRFYARIIEMKKRRRTDVGEHMTLVWENRDTAMCQIQEMIRTERITQEKAILHEIETYNDLVPGERELSATLLIAYEDPAERAKMLEALAGLKEHVFLAVGNARAKATFKPLPGELETRLPPVQYLRFPLTDEMAA